ncbi:hypothetical protein GX51_00489 [Blastomyces parvus]|uniref:Uncharacterized protein n=1 Tax=Blastomyces parvus TaxID=2060905 RepID=A0A2B7XMC3_9EURO|nr:hypothetical protein GX51_00489 [Blastomyces parvus]
MSPFKLFIGRMSLAHMTVFENCVKVNDMIIEAAGENDYVVDVGLRIFLVSAELVVDLALDVLWTITESHGSDPFFSNMGLTASKNLLLRQIAFILFSGFARLMPTWNDSRRLLGVPALGSEPF